MKSYSYFAVLCMLAMMLTGCGDPALNSLKKSTLSKDYDSRYWLNESKLNTPRWSQAVTFCGQREHFNLPNCAAVNTTVSIQNMQASVKALEAQDKARERQTKTKSNTGIVGFTLPNVGENRP